MRAKLDAWRRSPILLALVILAGTALLVPVYLGQGLPWGHAIAAALMVAVPGVLLGGCAWRFARRPRKGLGRRRALVVHGLAAMGFAVAWMASIYLLALPVHREAAQAFLYNGAPWQLVGGLILYAAIAANAQWLRTREQLTEQALVATRAELQALRAQLDPHFLFNTLHSLTQLARDDSAATEQALERFGDLMRYVLHSGRNETPEVALEDELAFIRHYLALEQLRLGERLGVEEALETEALELAVPSLLLQPLVENAVRHGIAPRLEGGTLRLFAAVEEDSLVVEVVDDGQGADPEGCWLGRGLGLSTVRRQLELHYPGSSRMEVTTAPGRGFAVRLVLPGHLPQERVS
ncbi:histidine kinase [Halomonas sp. LR3S48]|uniref:sensor histidine kinase n=1 Tax=Halomonas sp. LR3S48 TaxID=2982694 RepID=UPI0021E4CE5D|nr:histidine kinase [Halomonas sp. LR3S48]UYG05754.1 histidine kinase [Halomonas sp. LR3S48]